MGFDPLTSSIIMFAVSSAYQISQQNKQKKAAAQRAEQRKGFYFTQKNGDAVSIPVIYGKQLVGGIQTKLKVRSNYTSASNNASYTFTHNFTNSSQSGSKNEFLNAQYAICQGGIEGVQWVKVDGKHYNETSAKFTHSVRTFNDGGSACAISTANGINPNNLFTGLAFATGSFKLNRDEQNYSGPPDLEFFVKGRKVSTITGTAGSRTLGTTTFSNNPALVLLDYLTNTDFGRGLSLDEIDLDSFHHAAQVCGTVVTSGRSVGGRINGVPAIRKYDNQTLFPSTFVEGEEVYIYYDESTDSWFDASRASGDGEKAATYTPRGVPATRDISLYECNMTLDTEDNYRDNIERILNTMNLAELVWSGEGKYRLLLDYPTDQAETDALVDVDHVFEADDIARENVSIKWPTASDRFNQVSLSYVDEHEDFKTNTVTWPTYGSPVHTEYLTEDNQQPFKGSVDGEGVTNPYHALARAEGMVRKSRALYTVSLTITKKGLSVEPGDLIKVNLPNDLLNNEILRVESIEVNTDFTMRVSAYHFGHDILAWNVDDDVAYALDNVTDFTVDNPTNLTYTSVSDEERENTLGVLSWDSDAPVGYKYDVFYRRHAASEVPFEFFAQTGSTFFDILHIDNVHEGEVFDFCVKSVSPFGARSTGLELEQQSITVAPPQITSLSVSEEQYLTNNASGLKNRAIIDWQAGTGGLKTSYYLVEYKTAAETTYQTLGTTQSTSITLPDISDGVYNFRVTPFSFLEFSADPTVLVKTIVGFSEPPSDPSGFSGNINEGQINLTWTSPTDLDVLYGGHSQIRFHAATDGSASWDTSSILVEKLSGNTTNKTVPTLKGTFFLRFYDAVGNFSDNPSAFVSTFVDPTFNLVDTLDEDSIGFTGTKTNCEVFNGDLILSSGQTSMIYEFNSPVDMLEVVQVRLVPDLTVSVVIGGTTVATYVNIGQLDNFAGPLANASINVFVATTQDDPSGSPTWSDFSLLTIGSYTARAFKFKLEIAADDSNVDVAVSKLHINLDKKDLIKTGESTSSASADTTVTFDTAFYGGLSNTSKPILGTGIVGGSSGDNVVIVSKSKTSFSYSVYNGGSRVVRDIDWQAIGQ
jgi:hypothetical protein